MSCSLLVCAKPLGCRHHYLRCFQYPLLFSFLWTHIFMRFCYIAFNHSTVTATVKLHELVFGLDHGFCDAIYLFLFHQMDWKMFSWSTSSVKPHFHCEKLVSLPSSKNIKPVDWICACQRLLSWRDWCY